MGTNYICPQIHTNGHKLRRDLISPFSFHLLHLPSFPQPVPSVLPSSLSPSTSSGTEILPVSSDNMLARTVVVRRSFTPGSATLHPGLLTFNPFGVGFEQVPHCGRDIADGTSANFHIFTFPNFHILPVIP